MKKLTTIFALIAFAGCGALNDDDQSRNGLSDQEHIEVTHCYGGSDGRIYCIVGTADVECTVGADGIVRCDDDETGCREDENGGVECSCFESSIGSICDIGECENLWENAPHEFDQCLAFFNSEPTCYQPERGDEVCTESQCETLDNERDRDQCFAFFNPGPACYQSQELGEICDAGQCWQHSDESDRRVCLNFFGIDPSEGCYQSQQYGEVCHERQCLGLDTSEQEECLTNFGLACYHSRSLNTTICSVDDCRLVPDDELERCFDTNQGNG